jgi:S1-C subfamily serine protease
VPLPESQAALAGRPEGLLVVGVTAGSPAAAGGVLVGDVLFELDGRSVGSTDDLLELLGSIAVGKPAAVRVLRGAALVDVTLTVGERPAN